MRRPSLAVAGVLALLLAGHAAYNLTYWRWNDRNDVFRTHALKNGWPADQLRVAGGGHESAGLFGVLGIREFRSWVHPDRPGDVYEITLVRATPFGLLHMERAYAGPKRD